MKYFVLTFLFMSNLALTSEIDLGSEKIKLPKNWIVKESNALLNQNITLIFNKKHKEILGRLVSLDVSTNKGIKKNCPIDGEVISEKICLVFVKDKKDPTKTMPFIHFIHQSKKYIKEVTLAFDKTENKNKAIYKELANELGKEL